MFPSGHCAFLPFKTETEFEIEMAIKLLLCCFANEKNFNGLHCFECFEWRREKKIENLSGFACIRTMFAVNLEQNSQSLWFQVFIHC